MSPHAAPPRLAPGLSAAPGCPCCTRLPLLLPASQGSTGDPRLLSRRKAIASQAPPSRGVACRLMPPRSASCLRRPPKRHFWWTATSPSREPSGIGAVFPEGPALFRGTFHARGRFPGRSCVFPGDLPCQGPFSWKVRRFSGGPSMPGAVFPEGPRTGWRTGWRKGLHCGRDPFLTIWQ